MKKYSFDEKEKEFYYKLGKEIPVYQSKKYKLAKQKVIELLEAKEYKNILSESDFWILKNFIKETESMGYSGLIISHNGCLKINDVLTEDKRFKPECLKIDKDGYAGSLVFSYCCSEQGLYEVGEINKDNCKSPYPYAMALKRCFDRVVLKNSKFAYAGVYSDSEAEEFNRNNNEFVQKTPYDFEDEKMSTEQVKIITSLQPELKERLRNFYKKDPVLLTKAEAQETINSLIKNGLIKTKEETELEEKENEEVF